MVYIIIIIITYCQKKEKQQYIAVGMDVHRKSTKGLIIARLTHSPYTTRIGRIRCYTMLSTICKCRDVQTYNNVCVRGGFLGE